ncbi:MAG: multiheme c-type cytochrome [Leeuwenhoekiella sp.]
MNKKRSIAAAFLILVILVSWLYFQFNSGDKNYSYYPITPVAVHQNGKGFAGSETCIECHANIVASHRETAHYKSLEKANNRSILGDFQPIGNTLEIGSEFYLKMVAEDSSFFEESHYKNPNRIIQRDKIDLVVGSGTKGQSYLTWQDDKLFQLQVSYFTPTQSWVNSPGYPSGSLHQLRPVGARCLECHATYAQEVVGLNMGNRYIKNQLIEHIDCERCHGPAAEHVSFHKANPAFAKAKHITSYNNLGQQQKLDVCALCHSGVRVQKQGKPFTFLAGDTLDRFSEPNYDTGSLKTLDVHGNQYGLFTASKCFKKSEKMDCTTCHSPHKKERGNTGLFLQKCMSCHNSGMASAHCALPEAQRLASGKNCISCHMPVINSNILKITDENGDEISAKIRTHLIAIYPDN